MTAVRYAYSVWVQVQGTWSLVLATNGYSGGLQVVRGLQSIGYRTEWQRASLSGPWSITPAYRVELQWQGQTYFYGMAADGAGAYLAARALQTLFPTGFAYALNLSTGRRLTAQGTSALGQREYG